MRAPRAGRRQNALAAGGGSGGGSASGRPRALSLARDPLLRRAASLRWPAAAASLRGLQCPSSSWGSSATGRWHSPPAIRTPRSVTSPPSCMGPTVTRSPTSASTPSTAAPFCSTVLLAAQGGRRLCNRAERHRVLAAPEQRARHPWVPEPAPD
eukprot:scaffold689_cov375-Prasinococcus_capsulatus_cf.AAC.17